MSKKKLIGYAVKIGDGYVNKTDSPTMPIGWSNVSKIECATNQLRLYEPSLLEFNDVKQIADQFDGTVIALYARPVDVEEDK